MFIKHFGDNTTTRDNMAPLRYRINIRNACRVALNRVIASKKSPDRLRIPKEDQGKTRIIFHHARVSGSDDRRVRFDWQYLATTIPVSIYTGLENDTGKKRSRKD